MINFIMLIGLPGSGKSTYAKKLEEEGYQIHSSDAIRKELTGDINSQVENKKVFDLLKKRVREDLRTGKSCVYDATNLVSKKRRNFLNSLKKINCKKECILFLTTIAECKKRIQNREQVVYEGSVEKMLKTFWVPMYYEGWDNISVICDEYEYTAPLYLCYDFDQKNKHHHFSLLEHMYQTALYIENTRKEEELLKKSERMICLERAAIYHDIGKLYTRSFVNSKGEPSKEAHYYNHECYGAYLFLLHAFSSSRRKNYVPNGEIETAFYTAALINWHMRPYLAWEQSEKAKKRDRLVIGEKMYNDIMLLHKADMFAH